MNEQNKENSTVNNDINAYDVIDIPDDAEKTNRIGSAIKGLAHLGSVAKRAGAKVQDRAVVFAGKTKNTADRFIEKAKETSESIQTQIAEDKEKRDFEKYGPIFPNEIMDYNYPYMVSVVSHDKMMDLPYFQDAVAFNVRFKEGYILIVPYNNVNMLPISFYPSVKETVYYVHPYDSKKYVELDDYFSSLNSERIAELRHIAQSLGATHFSVKVKAQKSSFVKKDQKASLSAKKESGEDNVGIESSSSAKEYEFVGIADQSDFVGKAPVIPELTLWKNDPQINSLIKARMDKEGQLLKTQYTLNYNTSSGIKSKEAGNIEGILKNLKIKGSANITAEAERESKLVLEYEIAFKEY